MKTPKIRKILNLFKNLCKLQGWKISEKDDWIKTEEGYHNFVWTRSIHPSSFKSINRNRRCVVRENLSYQVVQASYTAWLFSEAPSETLIKSVSKNPEFSKRTAIYNLNPILEGKSFGYKLNSTDSHVFQEFEKFLKKKLKVELKTVSENDSRKKAITKTA